MEKRKKFIGAAGILVFFCLAFAGCVTTQSAPIQPPDPDANIAIVSVKREKKFSGNANNFNIYVDNELTSSVGNGEEARFEIPNGFHSIQLRPSIPLMLPSKSLPFTADSNIVSFSAKVGLLGAVLTPLGSTGRSASSAKAGGGNSRDSSSGGAEGIEDAINRVCGTLINDISRRSTVAVLSVSSRDRNMAVFVVDEIEFQLVDSKQFDMVDRKTLDSIRDEQNFQMSGEVDDNSAISIGNMLGASVVITGAITGSENTQRLTVKALDVKTAKIISMAREQF
ncbi:MAG: CsgG/HfaB family protein [Spirochaetaceae bacterium]|jgi:hypothetical protein|nr:CsgG/HfaB family protein [Spirochaetaceae bacterium]